MFASTQTNVADFLYVAAILKQKLESVEVAFLCSLYDKRRFPVVGRELGSLFAGVDLAGRGRRRNPVFKDQIYYVVVSRIYCSLER